MMRLAEIRDAVAYGLEAPACACHGEVNVLLGWYTRLVDLEVIGGFVEVVVRRFKM